MVTISTMMLRTMRRPRARRRCTDRDCASFRRESPTMPLITTTVVSRPRCQSVGHASLHHEFLVLPDVRVVAKPAVHRHKLGQAVPHRMMGVARFCGHLERMVAVLLPGAIHPVDPVESHADYGQEDDARQWTCTRRQPGLRPRVRFRRICQCSRLSLDFPVSSSQVRAVSSTR